MFDDAEIIHRYTRAQAIADGILVDVTSVAKEAGIRYPTAVTQGVWQNYVRVPEGVEAQDETGRLWDLLWVLKCAIRNSPKGDTVHFYLHIRNSNEGVKRFLLKACCGPDDDGSPCITVLLPDED